MKSKRDCAGYAQPLVYKQQNQGHGEANHPSGDQFTFHEQGLTPTLNLRWQSEQQHLATHHGFPQSDPSPFQQLPFSASYHAMPFVPASVPPHTSNTLPEGDYAWPGGHPSSSQPPSGVSDTFRNTSTAFHALREPD